MGWMSDNATLQCVAIILPRVQRHFSLSSTAASALSASTMSGMFVGAIAWGSLSDVLGRSLPFNATLFLTACFGLMASFSARYGAVCFWMFWLGSAVGGSMPTDGTLFLENLPQSKQYLLTLLSVFFSFGAVLSAAIGYIVLPGASCTGDPATHPCDIANGDNDGWRRMLFILGLVVSPPVHAREHLAELPLQNLAMFAARFVLFRLHESPRFLVAKKREDEAVMVLRRIASFNANRFSIDSEDVERDDFDDEEDSAMAPKSAISSARPSTDDAARRHPSPQRMDSVMPIPFAEQHQRYDGSANDVVPSKAPRLSSKTSRIRFASDVPLLDGEDGEAKLAEDMDDLPEAPSRSGWLHGLVAWKQKIDALFTPKWRRTTTLMWMIWGLMSLGECREN